MKKILLLLCILCLPFTVFASGIDIPGFTNPMTTTGDTIYGTTGGAPLRLPGNTSTVQKCLSQSGDGSNALAPSWQTTPTAGTLTYYLQPTVSDVAGDFKMLTAPYTISKANMDSAAISSSTDTIIKTFVSDPGFPGLTFIPAGTYLLHIHAERLSGNRTITLYGVFREVDNSGANIGTIGTQTESTATLTGSEVEYPALDMANANTYSLMSASSRIAIDIHAVSAGGTTNTTVRLFAGQTADSHISLPSNTMDATSFVPYSGATNNVDLGNFELIKTQTAPPTATCGGNAASVATGSTDMSGSFSYTGVGLTTCILTFADARAKAPFCVVNDNVSTTRAYMSASDVNTATFSFGAISNPILIYICF